MPLCFIWPRLAVVAPTIAVKCQRADPQADLGGQADPHPSGWSSLLPSPRTAREGWPCLRLTVVLKEPRQSNSQTVKILTNEASHHGLPFEFHVAVSSKHRIHTQAGHSKGEESSSPPFSSIASSGTPRCRYSSTVWTNSSAPSTFCHRSSSSLPRMKPITLGLRPRIKDETNHR
uniref:Secreted protein n=1 Tax=Leersia perrieri TaxID=77586 RepID=A0A0D9WFX5_9ORYZ